MTNIRYAHWAFPPNFVEIMINFQLRRLSFKSLENFQVHLDLNASLLLAMLKVELQIHVKKKLNRKMLEIPNICYVFGKLGVQGCQI